ncbi:MAG: hypothetical protein GY862_16770 [Gammaproteobacteria bacterium]|nr:hypothetical protein [Gammaproteobacteria bacterium]
MIGDNAKVSGPFEGFVEKLIKTLKELVTAHERSRGMYMHSVLFELNVSEADVFRFCYPAGKIIVLWRADAQRAATLNIAEEDGQSVEKDWPAQQNILHWPADELPHGNGKSYLFQLEGVGNSTVTLHEFAEEKYPSDISKAIWMTENSCVRQARLLLPIMPGTAAD